MKNNISKAILDFNNNNFYSNSLKLLNTLGYQSKKSIKIEPNTSKGFIDNFDTQFKLNLKKAKTEDWKSIDFILQITSDEISENISLFEGGKYDDKNIQSYLFFAIELKKDNYTRTELSNIAREINKLTSIPSFIIFKYKKFITFAIIERRIHKLDESRDVLKKVTLIKDINIEKPHRAHIEILFDLSLPELIRKHNVSNWVELHNAWLKTLDSSELNKKFYKEISNWYFWAIKNVKFPDDDKQKKEVHNATNVIRLITRLIFVWFLKEKGLIPQEIFNQSNVDRVLNKSDKTGSTYYKVILQNLFFATLNTEMNKDKTGSREFIKRSNYRNQSQQHLMPAFRYKRFLKNPDEALKLFEDIPFLNGGLFENLDYELINKKKRIIKRIDCFSDNIKNETLLKVPDFLFFSEEKQVDLSEDYGDNKRKKETVRGLIHILNRYKFTVEENTPIEEEIALDPELLGKVFENLLASYNPETHTTARKQTGSYYTPREIVNYMVDESIIAYLENKLVEFYESKTSFEEITPFSQSDIFGKSKPQQIKLGDIRVKLTKEQKTEINKQLHLLISYSETNHKFNDQEVYVLIKSIDDLKILDPACGSGAFPMGILHKLVYILSKLDPSNKLWKDEQIVKVQNAIEAANEIKDSKVREQTVNGLEEQIENIEDAFNNNELDYGRKLYLIENCIYGVDIQSIAVQIAKLRFFISLVIDQLVDPNKKNLNVRPLPNLETKFISANTLIGLDKPIQESIRNLEIEKFETQLKEIRKKHFNAKIRIDKQLYRKNDEKLRFQIAELLLEDGWDDKIAHQITNWDPYRQNITSKFFDSEWMFSVDNGFDIVIGNPPYGFRTVLNNREKKYFRIDEGISFPSGDSAELFSIKCFNNFVTDKGILTFIIPKKSLYGESWGKFRLDLWGKNELLFLLDSGKAFDNVLLEQSAFGLAKREQNQLVKLNFFNNKSRQIHNFSNSEKGSIFKENNTVQIYLKYYPESIISKIEQKSYEEKKISGDLGLGIGIDFFSNKKTDYKLLKGIDIGKWHIKQNRFLKNKDKLNWDNAKRFLRSKIICQRLVAHIENPYPHIKITACYDNKGLIITALLI